jgi:hypothetical protein
MRGEQRGCVVNKAFTQGSSLLLSSKGPTGSLRVVSFQSCALDEQESATCHFSVPELSSPLELVQTSLTKRPQPLWREPLTMSLACCGQLLIGCFLPTDRLPRSCVG